MDVTFQSRPNSEETVYWYVSTLDNELVQFHKEWVKVTLTVEESEILLGASPGPQILASLVSTLRDSGNKVGQRVYVTLPFKL